MRECDTAIKMYEENPLIMKSGTDVSFNFSRFTHREKDAVLTVPALYALQPLRLTALNRAPFNESSNEKNAFHTDWLDVEAPVKGE